jgi:hypothetical protein
VLSVWTSSGPSALYGDAFKPLAKNTLVFGEISFTRLPDSQLSRVQVAPSDAARIVKANYGSVERWRVVFESLGGYVNNTEIIHDWIGTKSLVPKAQPAYVVRITGPPIVSLGPGGTVNHYWNVVVNAITGRIIVGFTYD